MILEQDIMPTLLSKEKIEVVKGVLVDVKKDSIEVVEIEEGYKAIQKIIDVDIITVVTRNFNGTWYDIYADDEGWLKEEYNPASVYTYFSDGREIGEIIVGSVFVAKSNEEGETISLTDSDISRILRTMRVVLDNEEERLRKVLTCTF